MADQKRSDRAQQAHDRCAADRIKLAERLRSEDAHDLAKLLDTCGQEMRMVCCNCGFFKSVETKCKKRWCPSCARGIAAERVAKYASAAARFEWPLFVTLTIRNTTDPEGLKEIKRAWRLMRRRTLITKRVRSGIVGFEVTNKGNGWHPHLHALLDCKWLALYVPEPTRSDNAEKVALKCRAAAEELTTLWSSIVKQPTASVAVRRANAAALVEVLKYSCKGSELLACKDRVADLIYLMQRMRLMSTFGEIRRETPDEDLEDETKQKATCENCGNESTFVPADIVGILTRRAYDSYH